MTQHNNRSAKPVIVTPKAGVKEVMNYKTDNNKTLLNKVSVLAITAALGLGIGGALYAQSTEGTAWEELFYIGLIDLTAIEEEDSDDIVTNGRVAFYLKGKIKGETLITAALDTGEGELENIFNDLDKKDTESFIDRIDPNSYYPVYGDDSTIQSSAHTDGRLFVKIENGDSEVMWGTFKSNIEGTTFLRNNRSFYGARAVYNSPAKTTNGDARVNINAYGAQTGTLPQRDEFLGTGGSVYYLKHQDISAGSENLEVIAYYPQTDQRKVLKKLVAGLDYEINSFQGIVTLSVPLDQNPSDDTLIDDSYNEAELRLVVDYNFTPSASDPEDYSYGGRAQVWLTDRIRLGVSALDENKGTADQELGGADLRLMLSDNSYIGVEYADSEGTNNISSYSKDNGLTRTTIGAKAGEGDAQRAEVKLDLGELGIGMGGSLDAYYENRTKGFSTLTQHTESEEDLYGGSLEAQLNAAAKVKLSASHYENAQKEIDKLGAEVEYKTSDKVAITLGAERVEETTSSQVKERTDIAAKVDYSVDEDSSVYARVQNSTDVKGFEDNDRYALGGETRLSESLKASAEVSDGSTGFGASARLGYSDNDGKTTAYTGYTLDPSFKEGGIKGKSRYVVGASQKVNDDLTLGTENGYDLYGSKRALSSGVNGSYAISDASTLGGSFTYSTVEDSANTSSVKRYAISVSSGYSVDGMAAKLGLEYRVDEDDEDTTTTDEGQKFTAARLTARYTLSDSARLLFSGETAVTDSAANIPDGEYGSVRLGYAYRPIGNDRLNVLAQYRYLYDLTNRSSSPGGPPPPNNSFDDSQQISHVVGLDISYDLNPKVTLGGKLAARSGRIKRVGAASFEDNDQRLVAVNLRYHMVHNWDVLAEFRQRTLEIENNTADETYNNALIAINRHLGANIKFGVGYNFGELTDDLNDNSTDNRGAFVNIVGKF